MQATIPVKETARVWVFVSNRVLTQDEVERIRDRAAEFCTQWTAHKVALTAFSDVLHQCFLLISVDEDSHGASGCSIDAMHAFVRTIGHEFNLNFFDRLRVLYPLNDSVQNISLAEFEEKFRTGDITYQTPVFNTLVSNGKDLSTNFLIPVSETWLANRIR